LRLKPELVEMYKNNPEFRNLFLELRAKLSQNSAETPDSSHLEQPPPPAPVDEKDCLQAGLASFLARKDALGELFCIKPAMFDEEAKYLRLQAAVSNLAEVLEWSDLPAEGVARALDRLSDNKSAGDSLSAAIAYSCHNSDTHRFGIPKGTKCRDTRLDTMKAQKIPRPPSALNENRSIFRERIKNVIEKSGRPVGISFCSMVLNDLKVDRGNMDCASGPHGHHGITVVGVRTKADCSVEYLLQNSWGSWCPSASGVECKEKGRAWFPEDPLLRNTYLISEVLPP